MKILLATDGSDCSRTAIDECCRLVTRPADTEIKILSVYRNMYMLAGEPFVTPPEYLQQLADTQKDEAETSVTDAEKRIRDQLGDSVKTIRKVIPGAEPEQQIVEEAENWAPDVIVVGSHGRGFWGRMLGSVSNAVVHHANCSVLVAR